jgi:hypothetical protein
MEMSRMHEGILHFRSYQREYGGIWTAACTTHIFMHVIPGIKFPGHEKIQIHVSWVQRDSRLSIKFEILVLKIMENMDILVPFNYLYAHNSEELRI